jgi:L-aspartate oxidase
MIHKSDFLVIGTGIAGLTYAIRAAAHGSVAVITKKGKTESNTNYAQGGIAAVVSPHDSIDLHMKDTLDTGAGLCRPDAVRVMVEEGPARIRELMELGVEFTRRGGALELGREGGHSLNRIVHSKDLTGREIERALLSASASHQSITIFEDHAAIELLTEHQFVQKKRFDQTHCWGAYALNVQDGRIDLFLARAVLLATGGLGQVYLHTTNPRIATGDGLGMAFRAGARIANMEFVQFHPTTLFNSGTPSFLVSEAIRGFGGVLTTTEGDRFMERYDPRGSLAPRDVVAYAIDTELKKSGADYVHLDLRHLSAESVKEGFPHIYETCLKRFKLDITREPIPVVPAAHYSCGGVETDLSGRTTIGGLFAAGEVSMTGVHGANRLASNSLLEALVFAVRASDASIKHIHSSPRSFPQIREWDESGTLNSEEWVLVSHDRREIQQIMWDYVGIVRSDLRLQRAERRIRMIRDEIEEFYKKTRVSEGLIELRNLALCADLIIQSSLKRKESRGLFMTTDYPMRDDDRFCSDTIVSLETGLRKPSPWKRVVRN